MTVERDGTGLVLGLYGELDLLSAPALERQLKRLQWAGTAAITIDLSGLDFMDSSGLHVLMRAADRCARGQALNFLRGPRRVQRVLELTHVDERLRFID